LTQNVCPLIIPKPSSVKRLHCIIFRAQACNKMKSQADWKDNKLFLLDAYALIYRAYFAMSRAPLINSKGMNTSAISGFTNTLMDLISREKPTHLAVVFDLAGSEIRETAYADYKANREEMPEDIQLSLPWIRKIIEAFHIPVVELEGYEADDLIGTLALKKASEGHLVYMVTPDKDYGQLVGDNRYIYKPGRQGSEVEILGVPEICARWEVDHPDQVIDILGLMGDSVDNIPGIPGVGEKTAKKLIRQFGSLEAVLENASEVKGKLGENLRQFAEQGILSKQLATIIKDAPIDLSDEELKMDPPDRKKLAEIFSELEFRTLSRRVLGEEVQASPARSVGMQGDLFSQPAAPAPEASVAEFRSIHNSPHDYRLVQTPEQREDLLRLLSNSELFCFDTETTSLDLFSLELVGMSFSVRPGEAWYMPLPEDRNEVAKILAPFRELFTQERPIKVGQNIKFDLHVLKRYGIEVQNGLWDTMLAHYLLEPDMKHGMDYLSETYLSYRPVSIESLIGKKGKEQGNMRDVPLDKIKEYAAEDADVTLRLREVFAPMLREREVENIFTDIETPLIPVLADMEWEGVRVDDTFLKQYSEILLKDLIESREQVFKLCNQEFNLDSPKQLGEVLFGQLGLPYSGPKTKTGQYSTGEEVLQTLQDKHPVVQHILEYREIAKLKSTYVDALPLLINPLTGRVHTTFNQTIAATGRLSSLNPNIQNIPIRTERGQQIRRAFVPRDEEHILLSADYSQIELRLVAELSEDENMLSAFEQGMDIHQATAARVFGVGLDEVSREMRSKAKMVNFGIIYSISAFGLSQRLGIPRAEAKTLIDQYFAQFPGIRRYMDETLEFARKNGFVKTIMGRRRYLKDINSANFTVRGFAEREAINAPVQGSAADMIKLAMIRIHQEIKSEKLRSRMILQVHDELVFDVYKPERQQLEELVRHHMKSAIPLRVPIEVETGIGDHWLDAH